MKSVQELYDNFQYDNAYTKVTIQNIEYTLSIRWNYLSIFNGNEECMLNFNKGTMKVYQGNKLLDKKEITIFYWLILQLAIDESLERLYVDYETKMEEVD